MKRILSLFLAFIMISGLAACGGGGAEESSQAPSADATEPAQTQEDTTEAAAAKDYYTADDYLADPSLFVPAWEGEFTPNPALLDFEEKWASFLDPAGRAMSVGHRAERNIYYPENSLEGIMSVIAAGVDFVELDVHKTLDNIVVIMHDTDLLGTTDLALRRLEGEDEGLPESNSIRDWTLEQLRELRLTKGNGGEESEYVIATLEDAIRVCKDHCFIMLDDKKNELDWNMDVFTLLRKHDAYRTVLPIYNYGSRSGFDVLAKICETLAKNNGTERTPYVLRTKSTEEGLAESAAQIEEYGLFPGLRCGEYDPSAKDIFRAYAGKYRIYMETLSSPNDNADTWNAICEAGGNIIMSNTHTYELINFISEKYFG